MHGEMNGEPLRAFVCVREIQSSSGASGLGRGRGRCRTAVSSLGGPPWSRDPTPARARDRAARGGEGLPGRLPGFPRGPTSRTPPPGKNSLGTQEGKAFFGTTAFPDKIPPPGGTAFAAKKKLIEGRLVKGLVKGLLDIWESEGCSFFATKLEKKIEQLFSRMLIKLRQILTGLCLEILSFLKNLNVFCDRRTSNPFLVVEGDGEGAGGRKLELAFS